MLELGFMPAWIAGYSLVSGHLLLASLMCIAAAIDWHTYRLPNRLTFGGMALGLAWSLLPGGVEFLHAVAGVATSMVLFLPMYVLRAMGAGDVKLMGMAGAFLGLPEVLLAVLLTLAVGGVAAVAFAAWRRNLARMLLNARDLMQVTALAAAHGRRPALGAIESAGKLPYGVCVCIGTLGCLAYIHLFA